MQEDAPASTLNKVLTYVLLGALLFCVGLVIYLVITPKEGEHFTEFYILGPEGKAAGYPHNLTSGEDASVIIGIVNHEYRTVDYIVELWLVDASFENNITTINHMYFIDSFKVELNHTYLSIDESWTPQLEQLYKFSIDRKGKYKLWFLMFKDQVPPLPVMSEYAGTDVEKRILDAVEGDIQGLNLNLVVS